MHLWGSLWWVLAVESINGITFACFWPAGTLHCTKIAPPGMAATVQVTPAPSLLHYAITSTMCNAVLSRVGLVSSHAAMS